MANQDIIDKLRSLTSQQKKVLKGVCEGKPYKEIAKGLFLSVETIKTHMGNVYLKLGLMDLPPTLRKKIIFEEYWPVFKEFDFDSSVIHQEEPEDTEEPEPVSDDVIKMVEKDELALMVIEPKVIDFSPFEEDETEKFKREQERIKEEQERIRKEEEKKKKRRRIRRWVTFFIILVLLIFGGIQVYAWARGFKNDVVQPNVAQNTPDQLGAKIAESVQLTLQVQQQAQVIPTSSIREVTPTQAPAQQVAVATSTSQPTAPPQPKILFSDNFDAGLSSGWQVAYGNPIIVNGVLSTDQDTLLIVGDTSWRDYAVEFDADAGDCWLSAGENWVSVRTVDTDNNYAYKWEDCESYWYVVKNGSWNEIPKSEFSPGYDTLRFKVQVEGGNMSVYVDGTLMSSFFDNGYSQGRVILKISENTTIDNFVIKELE